MKLTALLSGFLLASALLSAAPVTLYDGNSNAAPAAPWFTFAPGITVTANPGYTTFNSTAFGSLQGGTSRTDVVFDTEAGFWLRFLIRLSSETHASTDRAGLSIIVTGANLEAIELGFWIDQVWAQNVGFTKGESGSIANGEFIRYNLLVQNGEYQLFGNSSPLVSGLLRNYSSFGAPYNVTNFLFIGDDTTSARASFDLAHVEFEAIPEPGSWLLAAAGILAIGGLSAARRASRCNRLSTSSLTEAPARCSAE